MAKYGAKSRKMVKDAMHKMKRGKLKSSHGRTVTKRSQALAIGLSEARRKGAKVPKKTRKSKPAKKTARAMKRKTVTTARKKKTARKKSKR